MLHSSHTSEIKLKDQIYSKELPIPTSYDRLEDYTFGEEIGKGAYAVVKKAIHNPTKEIFAIKIYEKSRLIDLQKKNSVKKEIQILKKINHKNIVKLYEIIQTTHQVIIS